MRGLGVSKGDVIALLADDGVDFIVNALAVSALGAILLPLNPKYGLAELSLLFEEAQPLFILSDASVQEKVRLCNPTSVTLI